MSEIVSLLLPCMIDFDLILIEMFLLFRSCYCSRLPILDIQYLALTHEFGGEIYIVQLGGPVDKETTVVTIDGNCAFVRTQVPADFYDNITTLTDAQALGVFL